MRVPRYTSYPTAPHFSDAVGGETYADWLSNLNSGQNVSIYFHVPFCDTLCWFCGCHTKIVRNYKPVSDYIDVLKEEVCLVSARVHHRVKATHIHWGGGSPTILTGDDWLQFVDLVAERFDIVSDAEIAVEMDPRDSTEDYVQTLARAGVNRVSVGVQDFDPEVQKAVNRIQGFETTERVIGWLRRHGISGLNMDLMYGLPHQTTERVVSMVDLAVGLEPQRIALFGYAHVPWMKAHQTLIDAESLPDSTARWDQAQAAAARLVEAGYEAIGLDHFARPDDPLAEACRNGRLHRNFQGYTVDEAPVLLGFGASAIGSLPEGYVQNQVPIEDYENRVRNADFAIAKGIEFSTEDRLRGEIIERLMCDLRVDIGAIKAKHKMDDMDFGAEFARLSPLVEDGIALIEQDSVTVTEQGRPFLRLVAAVFDTYLKSGKARHSKAV